MTTSFLNLNNGRKLIPIVAVNDSGVDSSLCKKCDVYIDLDAPYEATDCSASYPCDDCGSFVYQYEDSIVVEEAQTPKEPEPKNEIYVFWDYSDGTWTSVRGGVAKLDPIDGKFVVPSYANMRMSMKQLVGSTSVKHGKSKMERIERIEADLNRAIKELRKEARAKIDELIG